MSIFLAAVGLSLLGLGIVNTSTSDRYTIGWYAIRGFSLAAMSTLLVMLIWALSRIDRASVEQLERDTLTGVLRRPHFQDLLSFELERIRAGHGGGALLWIDLDAFKAINDRLGHTGGDEILAMVGQRLRATAGEQDLVGRVGGDEFSVLGVGVTPTEAHRLAERLRLALRDPYPIEPAPALLTAAIGIAAVDSPVPDALTLLRQADLAAYRAKAAGGDQVAEYTASIEDEVRQRADMRAELAEALRNGDFDLDYQPIIAIGTGEVAGLEALVRWLHNGRRVPAQEFIATIEETGQVRQMGAHVLATLNRDAPALLDALPPGAFLAVNLSVSELAGAQHWVPLLQGPLSAEPGCFVLEVTETADLVPGTPADLALTALRGAGFALAVDDFGTGYSNFDRLEALGPTIVKLDRSVIERASAGQPTALHFLSASVSIGHDMGALVLVEGVETAAQLELAGDLGADLVQGWVFSRALPLGPVLEYIRAERGHVALSR
jgi:diguanylate cyclase (GGDEF)-like protein